MDELRKEEVPLRHDEAEPDGRPDPERAGWALSRRTFVKGLMAAGMSMSFLATGSRFAKAQFKSFAAVDLSDEQLLGMYDKMLDIRWFERTLADKTIRGESRGSGHLYAGQEAIAVGTSFALRPDDYVLSTHRGHGHAIAKGVDMKKAAAEITYKTTGTNKGFGGSMHISDPSVGFLGCDGIVGPGATYGAGVAYAVKVKGSDQVALTYGGDGHFGSHFFHTALNEAAVAKLPFIYMIENNHYLQYTHYKYTTTLDDLAQAAKTYGIPGVTVNGQDVLAVYNVVREAAARARAGDGPTLIEAKTYRYYNHSGTPGATEGQLGAFGPDPLLINVTRPERELRAWLARDPIAIFRRTLIEFGVLDEQGAVAREEAAKARAEEAFRFADESPTPNPEDGLKNVFAETVVPARHIVAS